MAIKDIQEIIIQTKDERFDRFALHFQRRFHIPISDHLGVSFIFYSPGSGAGL